MATTRAALGHPELAIDKEKSGVRIPQLHQSLGYVGASVPGPGSRANTPASSLRDLKPRLRKMLPTWWEVASGEVTKMGRRENEMELPTGENEDLGWKDVMAVVIRMADTLERLVVILEDLSSVVELPEAAEQHRDVQDERDREREDR